MEKYGFVYIWFDRKHKRFYIGSHWGTEDDGYICSSPWMRNAFKRRPNDFKRRLLKTNLESRKETLNEENRWLKLIKSNELGKRYYNLRNQEFGHWSADKNLLESTRERISKATKQAMWSDKVRTNYLKGLERRNQIQSEETREKRRQSMRKAMAKKFPVEQRRKRLKKGDPQLSAICRKNALKRWANR